MTAKGHVNRAVIPMNDRAPFASCGITLLRPKELKDILGLSMDTIYRMMRQKSFPTIRIGRRYYVEASAFEKWLTTYTGDTYTV